MLLPSAEKSVQKGWIGLAGYQVSLKGRVEFQNKVVWSEYLKYIVFHENIEKLQLHKNVNANSEKNYFPLCAYLFSFTFLVVAAATCYLPS